MSYTYLLEQGEESLVECFSDIPACVLSRSTPTADESCSSVSGMESSRGSPSGTMSPPLTVDHGEGGWISSAEGSHARTFPPLEKARGSLEREAGYGPKWRGSLARFDLDSCGWKTHRCLYEEDLPWSSVTLPRWGLMRGGECWERIMPAHRTSGIESGYWPTPCLPGNGGSNGKRKLKAMLFPTLLSSDWNPNEIGRAHV